MGREYDGYPKRSRCESAQDAGFRGVHGDQLGTELGEDPPDFEQRPHVSHGGDRHGEVAQHDRRRVAGPKLIDEQPGAAGDDGGGMAMALHGHREVADVDLRPPIGSAWVTMWRASLGGLRWLLPVQAVRGTVGQPAGGSVSWEASSAHRRDTVKLAVTELKRYNILLQFESDTFHNYC